MSSVSFGEFLAFVSSNISSVSFPSFLLSGTHITCRLDHLTHILSTCYPLLCIFYLLASLCFILDKSFWPIFHFMNSLFSYILSVLKYVYWDLCFNYCIFSVLEFLFVLFWVLPLPFLIALTLGWNSQCCSSCLFSTYLHVISSRTRHCIFKIVYRNNMRHGMISFSRGFTFVSGLS